MSNQLQPPPYVYDGLDPVRERKSIFAEATDVMTNVVTYIGDAIERGRKPGMPLSILSNVTREAPLGSLLVAFLLGVAVARRASRRSYRALCLSSHANPQRPRGRSQIALPDRSVIKLNGHTVGRIHRTLVPVIDPDTGRRRK
jgi:hypothetical protein